MRQLAAYLFINFCFNSESSGCTSEWDINCYTLVVSRAEYLPCCHVCCLWYCRVSFCSKEARVSCVQV